MKCKHASITPVSLHDFYRIYGNLIAILCIHCLNAILRSLEKMRRIRNPFANTNNIKYAFCSHNNMVRVKGGNTVSGIFLYKCYSICMTYVLKIVLNGYIFVSSTDGTANFLIIQYCHNTGIIFFYSIYYIIYYYLFILMAYGYWYQTYWYYRFVE